MAEDLLPLSDVEREAKARRDGALRCAKWRRRTKERALVDSALVDAFLALHRDRRQGTETAPLTIRDVTRRGHTRLVALGADPVSATAAIARRLQPENPLASADRLDGVCGSRAAPVN